MATQHREGGRQAAICEPVVEVLDEMACLSLIAGGGVGRIGYTGRFGPAVLPVNYHVHEGTIVFRTGMGSAMVSDLRTGIADAEYSVAFEIDQIQPATQEGWSVLVQGAVHFVDSADGTGPDCAAGACRPGPGVPRSSSSASSPGTSPAQAASGGFRASLENDGLENDGLENDGLDAGTGLALGGKHEFGMFSAGAIMRASVGDMLVVHGAGNSYRPHHWRRRQERYSAVCGQVAG